MKTILQEGFKVFSFGREVLCHLSFDLFRIGYSLSHGFQPQSKDEEKKETMRIALFESLGTDYDHI